MGIHIDNLSKLGDGFHLRASRLRTDEIFELAALLGIDTCDAPDTDLYDWVRQRIYDELQATQAPRP